MIETNRYLWLFYSESIPNEGQRSQGKNFGKQTVECFVYDEEGCQGTVPFRPIRVHLSLANEKAAINGPVKRLSVDQHSSHIRWRL